MNSLKEWDAETQQRFHEQDVDVRDGNLRRFVSCIHTSGPITSIFWELPLSRLSRKALREYLAFRRWVPTLIRSGAALFDFPLSDWLASAPSQPVRKLLAASRLMQSGPARPSTGRPARPCNVQRGHARRIPRRIRVGWGRPTEIPTVRLANGREYEKVNVNQLWSTIRSESTFSYVGPHEILEGRALVMNLLFLWHLLDYEDRELTRTLSYSAPTSRPTIPMLRAT